MPLATLLTADQFAEYARQRDPKRVNSATSAEHPYADGCRSSSEGRLEGVDVHVRQPPRLIGIADQVRALGGNVLLSSARRDRSH
jgi:hypothetical protein